MRQRAMEGKREREGRESIGEREKEGGMGEQEREEEREIDLALVATRRYCSNK